MPRYENLYHLVQAYDRLGLYLYSNEWTGDEIFAYCPVPIEEASQKRAVIDAQLKGIEDRQHLIEEGIRREVQKHIIEDLKRQRASLNQRRAELHEALWNMPEVNESFRNDFAKVLRREHVKDHLLGALRGGKLIATFGGAMVFEPARLTEGEDYKLYFDQSFIILAKKHGHHRRASVFIDRDVFETWLKSIDPVNLPDDHLKVRERRFVDFFKAEIPKGRKSKEHFLNIAKIQFDIGKRAFERLWEEHAPPEWKRKGRIAEAKKSPRG